MKASATEAAFQLYPDMHTQYICIRISVQMGNLTNFGRESALYGFLKCMGETFGRDDN